MQVTIRTACRVRRKEPRVATVTLRPWCAPASISTVNEPTWAVALQAIGTVSIPVVVAILAYVLTRTQSRSEELLRGRLDYYKSLAPDLNRLLCYITFIGSWRDRSPVDIVNLKRRLDEHFYCAAPLFSEHVLTSYEQLMSLTFETFGPWGVDARIKSNAYRRRQCWQGTAENAWRSEWNHYFTLPDTASISRDELLRYRRCHDELIASLVRDLDLTRSRARYTTDLVTLNADAPQTTDITGSEE